MNGNNIVDFDAYKGTGSVARSNQRPDRGKEAADLLAKLRSKKRLAEDDRAPLVDNLGRMLLEIERTRPDALAKRILDEKWDKRRRYVRWPEESPHEQLAASGGDFSTIIQRLIDEKTSRGFDSSNALIETVHDALRGTSFVRSSRFRMPGSASDAAFLVSAMDKVLTQFAQEADLSEYFALVSKYPVYLGARGVPELKADRDPNDLHRWGDRFVGEDELQTWIPWWAPKCVIGHLYIPFNCRELVLFEEEISKIAGVPRNELTEEVWKKNECSACLEPYVKGGRLRPDKSWHRLPVWLIVLQSPTGPVFCLYASVHYWDEFQYWKSSEDKIWEAHCRAIAPCFISAIFKNGDAEYFEGDDNTYDDFSTSYVAGGNPIRVIGSLIDSGVDHFKPEIQGAETIDDLPVWLHAHPVQRLLKLSTESDAAKLFALSPRTFPEELEYRYAEEVETAFRPVFPEASPKLVAPVRQNTIGAYLLRNFAGSKPTILEALKADAVSKATAARKAIESELEKFHSNFDSRYGDLNAKNS